MAAKLQIADGVSWVLSLIALLCVLVSPGIVWPISLRWRLGREQKEGEERITCNSASMFVGTATAPCLDIGISLQAHYMYLFFAHCDPCVGIAETMVAMFNWCKYTKSLILPYNKVKFIALGIDLTLCYGSIELAFNGKVCYGDIKRHASG